MCAVEAVPTVSTVFPIASVFAVSSVCQDYRETVCRLVPTGQITTHRGFLRCVFRLIRGLKACPALAGAGPEDLRPVLRLWHDAVKHHLPMVGFEDVLIEGLKAWDGVKWPEGTGPFHDAVERARKAAPPACAHRYDDPAIKLLCSVCRELQREADRHGRDSFPLSCRLAGEVLGCLHKRANRWLNLLCREGVLRLVKRYERKEQMGDEYKYLGGGET